MTESAIQSSPSGKTLGAPAPWVARGSIEEVPPWVASLVSSMAVEPDTQADGIQVTQYAGPHAGLRTVVIPGAIDLDDQSFMKCAQQGYVAILSGIDPSTIARIWNFIPGINDNAGVDRDRYMMFNAGRYRAFKDCIGESERFPVASGVGHAGGDLVIHLLHGASHVNGVGNPRQCPPHKYSDRYGELPPAFSRAGFALIGDAPWFLLSGTASVVGEDSSHLGDAVAQLAETIDNIKHVLDEAQASTTQQLCLGKATDWLVYSTFPGNDEGIRTALCETFDASPENIIVRRQPLCREELLVEIECASRVEDGEVVWS